MNIDVSKIVQDKIDSLAKKGVIEKTITETFEKTITKAVTDSLDSYKLRTTIEEKFTQEVNKVVADLDFQSYNAFMCEKMMQIINETCREDLCEKIEKKFKDIFLCQTKEIKLSEIFKKYRKIACENVDELEKYDRMDEGWHYKLEEDEKYGWIKCELDCEDIDHRYIGDSAIAFTIHRNMKDKTIGKIYTLYLDGERIDKKFNFRRLNDVEIMLVQATMNEIPIIIDITGDDVDNSWEWDIDY